MTLHPVVRKRLHTIQVVHQPGTYPGFCSCRKHEAARSISTPPWMRCSVLNRRVSTPSTFRSRPLRSYDMKLPNSVYPRHEGYFYGMHVKQTKLQAGPLRCAHLFRAQFMTVTSSVQCTLNIYVLHNTEWSFPGSLSFVNEFMLSLLKVSYLWCYNFSNITPVNLQVKEKSKTSKQPLKTLKNWIPYKNVL